VRGCIQRRIGQLAVRDEQDIGAAVHHLMREAISMHSGMPLGCHQRPRCWPMAKWCNQKQSEAIREAITSSATGVSIRSNQNAITSSATGVSIRSNQKAITSSATGVSSTSRARRRGPATSVPPPKLHTREIEREIECTHARSSGRLSMVMSALGGNHHVHSEAIRSAITCRGHEW
jgi:hypothetical protein